jgi:hypothetical protein
MLRQWAAQKRRAMTGIRRFADGGVHEDGWPEISISALAREGGSTGGSGAKGQQFDEVYSGDGLTIWRILSDSPYEVREILFAHFVAAGDAKRKARELQISLPTYWNRLNNAYYYVAGRMDRTEGSAAGGGLT